MQISQDGIRLIKSFEDMCYMAYPDSAGIWTIGYRHTDGVLEGMTTTRDAAEKDLATDLAELAHNVDAYVSVPLTQHQFDALVAFCFDLGSDTLRRSDLLAFLNAGQYQRAADAILEYDTNYNQRRRNAERTLFLTPDRKLKSDWWQKFTTWLSL